MTTNKPEVVAYANFADMELCMHRPSGDEWAPVIRLSDCQRLQADHERLQAECEKLHKAIRRLCNIYVVDDYYSGDLREERLNQAIAAALEDDKP